MKKWVLVRSRLGNLYVLQRKEWEIYNARGLTKEVAVKMALLAVAESDDRDELLRFKELTKE